MARHFLLVAAAFVIFPAFAGGLQESGNQGTPGMPCMPGVRNEVRP
jgi:hypothetical protein